MDVRGILNAAIGGVNTDNVSRITVCSSVQLRFCFFFFFLKDDRLLKPISGFAGYDSEMRDLAAIISRVRYLF